MSLFVLYVVLKKSFLSVYVIVRNWFIMDLELELVSEGKDEFKNCCWYEIKCWGWIFLLDVEKYIYYYIMDIVLLWN